MMNEFDHRPDPILGDALRDALTLPEDPGFVQRVLDRMPQVLGGETWWEILGEWARPGLAGAVALLLAVSVWWAGRLAPEQLADERVPAETLSAGTLVTTGQPDFGLEMVLGEERVND